MHTLHITENKALFDTLILYGFMQLMCFISCTHDSAGFFYIMLGNVHPKYRSRFHMIQLAAICKSENISKYSLDTVLGPLIADIKKLVCNRLFEL